MCRVLHWVVILVFISGCNARKLRITEGLRVKSIEDYPFIASFRYKSKHICGGSVISKRYILTAAHCVYPEGGDPKLPELSSVRVGSLCSLYGGKIYQVEKFEIYDLWKFARSLPYFGDVALLKLKTDIEFSEKVQPVKLPGLNGMPLDGSTVIVLGWGWTDYEDGPQSRKKYLLYTKMQVYNNEQCMRVYREYLDDTYEDKGFKSIILPNDRMICLEGEGDFCYGDSGGPVLDENNIQVGIISFNLDCGTEAPVPSAVTDVARMIWWILNTAGIKEAYDGISDQLKLE